MTGSALTTLTRLTLSAAVLGPNDAGFNPVTQIQLSALTGIVVYNPLYSATDKNAATLLVCDGEVMRVLSIDDTTNYYVTVARGHEGYISGHGSGRAVWVAQPNQLYHKPSYGYEASNFDFNPRLDVAAARLYFNVAGYWSSYGAFEAPSLFTYGAPNSATLAGIAAPGTTLVDLTNAELYMNVGTAASPLWMVMASRT